MENYENEVVDETTTEETVTTENTGVDTEETQDSTEDIDWKAEALKEKARREKAEATIEKAKSKGKIEPKEKAQSNDEVIAARLEARGVLNAEDQAYILKYAKVEGIHYLEALEDDLVKDRLDRNKKARLSAQAAPKGNNRAPGTQNEVDAAIKKYERDGTLPDNPALIVKVMKAIKK